MNFKDKKYFIIRWYCNRTELEAVLSPNLLSRLTVVKACIHNLIFVPLWFSRYCMHFLGSFVCNKGTLRFTATPCDQPRTLCDLLATTCGRLRKSQDLKTLQATTSSEGLRPVASEPSSPRRHCRARKKSQALTNRAPVVQIISPNVPWTQCSSSRFPNTLQPSKTFVLLKNKSISTGLSLYSISISLVFV